LNHVIIVILLIMTRKLFLALLLGLFSFSLYAQTNFTLPGDAAQNPYWIEMMQDPEVNFYDVQHAFNVYMEGRDLSKIKGWKPFKRWEYRMLEGRILPDGTRRPDDYIIKEYQQYMAAHPGARSPEGSWVNLGPYEIPVSRGYVGLGRLNAIAFDPVDPEVIWVGAPSGGLWKTTNGGNNWTSSTQHLPSLGVSSILIDHTHHSVMYIGTGDRDAGDAFGIGVYRSTDGGETWEQWNNGMGNRIVGMMVMNPNDNMIILAATNGGVYRTTDGGANWSHIISGNFKDIVLKPNDANIVYAAGNGNFFRSIDNGQTFSLISNGLPGSARAAIAVTPANPNYVYVILTNSDSFKGLYRSTDSGQSFSLRSNAPNIMSWGCNGGSGGQAWYDLDIAVDPTNSDIVFAGGVNCFKSSSGGTTWNISSHWWGDCGVTAVHADLHILEYNPLNNRLYAGNDGGIYYTDNQGASWVMITNDLPITQIYKIGQSATVKDKVVTGTQDNGTFTYLGDNYWLAILGGDGMECAVDHQDANYSYATIYYGRISRFYQNVNNGTVAQNGFNGIDESGAWVTPFILDENDPNIMFVGYKNVWRSPNIKAPTSQIIWEKISDNLAGNNSQNMRVLEQSPANTDILFAARYDNKLFRTDNCKAASPLWFDLTGLLPVSGGINDVECHPFDQDIVYLSQNNRIYKSIDRGQSWEDISGTLPNVAYTSIAYYLNSHEGLYVSCDLGVFYKDQFMSDWIMFSDGLPPDASVREVEIYYDPADPAGDMIRAGTYGRGLWESDMYHYPPNADFTTNETTIPAGCALDFTDLSSGVPTAWRWEFDGADPSISYDRNPAGVLYSTPGDFQVKLVVSNEAGADSVIYADYISVSDTILPLVEFSTDATNVCTDDIVHFYDNSQHCPDAWTWSFSPATIAYLQGTNANSQNPVVEFRQSGVYSVTLTVTNQNGQNTLTKTDYIQAGGYFLPFEEDFESGSFTDQSWTVVNPDFGYTWENFHIEETGNHAARMKFYGYVKLGERDRLISPYLNFSQFSNVYLTFDHAYSQRFSQQDSLIIYIAGSCSEDWVRIWAGAPDGHGGFETASSTPYEFVPINNEDWCSLGWGADCFTIDLTDWAGQTNLKIMFEAFNDLGNNLYLDNIVISNTTGESFIEPPIGSFTVFPNPSRGVFTLYISGITGRLEAEVLNTQGQLVWKNDFTNISDSYQHVMNLSDWSKGIYFIRLVSDERVMVRKIIIE